MFLWTFSFSLGIATFLLWISFPHEMWGLLLLALSGALLWGRRHGWILLLSGYVAGFGYTEFRSALQLRDFLPSPWYESDVGATGVVRGIPSVFSLGTRFEFKTSELCRKDQCISKKITLRLSWYGQPPSLKPGERWKLKLRLKPLHGLSNPGGTNKTLYLWIQGIAAEGRVTPRGDNELLPGMEISQGVNRFRESLLKRLLHTLPPSQSRGVIIALILGMRSEMPSFLWQRFQDTGTSHLMAISGLHISLVAGFCFFLGSFILRQYPPWLLWLPAKKGGGMFALVGALIYSLMAGFSISTKRAFIMVSVAVGSFFLKRKVTPAVLFASAFLLILLINPFSLLNVGFCLSFFAVGVIFILVAYRSSSSSSWRQSIKVQMGLIFALLPLSFWYFGQWSWMSFVANLFAIPWTSFVIVPLSFLGVLFLPLKPLASFFFTLAQWACECLLVVLGWIQNHSEIFYFSPQKISVFLLWVLGTLFLLLPRGWPGRWVGVLWIVLSFLFQEKSFHEHWRLRLTVLDVGQGLAVVVETKNETFLYDTGPDYSEGFDAGKGVILPFLRHLGIFHLNKIIISHGDRDHRGGLHSVLKVFPNTPILTSDPRLVKKEKNASFCERGQHWETGNVSFRILYPPPHLPYRANNSSCVLSIETGNVRILLPGDMEKEGEAFLTVQEKNLSSQILVAPHHGSKTSSTKEFVKKVHPLFVIYGVGWFNRYHFPHGSVVSRYEALGAKGYETAKEGAIQFIIDENQSIIGPVSYGVKQKYVWNQN